MSRDLSAAKTVFYAHAIRLACLALLEMTPNADRADAVTRLTAETRDLTFRPALWELVHLTRDHVRTFPQPVTEAFYPIRLVADACRSLGPVEFKLWFDLALMGQLDAVGVTAR